MHYTLAFLPATHTPTVHLHTQPYPPPPHTHTHKHTHTTHTHKHTHTTHTQTHPCHTHTHTHTHTQTHPCHTHTYTHAHTYTHTHRDWACITCTCSDFGLLFLKLFSQSIQLCECTHLHCYMYVNSLYIIFSTHTQSELVPLAATLGSYFSHCFHKAYVCMNVHTCLHTHTHTHTHTYTRTHTQGLGLYNLQ